MQWDDLLKTADELTSGTGKSRRPRQSNLRRAVSTAYYAMFHCLARCCADTLVGSRNAERSKHAWRQVYRALEHGTAKQSCKTKRIIEKFPHEIEDFANNFVALQEKRHSADYDPYSRFSKLEVISDISTARETIKTFQSADLKDRRAFAAFVLLKTRPDP